MFTTKDFINDSQALPPFEQIVADEQLRQRLVAQIDEACGILMRLDELKVCEINVAVTQGQVVLSGQVECCRLRRLAESIVRFTTDAASVTNQIQIGKEAPAAASAPAPIASRLVEMAEARQ